MNTLMPRSVVEEVFSRVRPAPVATGVWRGLGPDRFGFLRVPDGEVPDEEACLTVKIGTLQGGPGGGIMLTPGRYKLTNELAMFLADSSAGIFSYNITRDGMDVYATLG